MEPQELTKGQYIEVENLFKEYQVDIKDGLDRLEERLNQFEDDQSKRMLKIEKGLHSLQVKNGVFATIMSAFVSFVTAYSIRN